jgi:hypothetical protein
MANAFWYKKELISYNPEMLTVEKEKWHREYQQAQWDSVSRLCIGYWEHSTLNGESPFRMEFFQEI